MMIMMITMTIWTMMMTMVGVLVSMITMMTLMWRTKMSKPTSFGKSPRFYPLVLNIPFTGQTSSPTP